MRKTSLFLCVLVLLLTCSMVPSLLVNASAIERSRDEIVLETKINEIGANGLLYAARDLPFVEGGTYKLLEFEPMGYAIYHPEAYLFVEYSLATQSPYIEYSDNILYGGPMSYLHFENDELLNVQSLEIENIIATRNSELGEYYQQLQYQDIRAKEFISGERDSYAAPRTAVNRTYVLNSHFLEFLTNFGAMITIHADI